MTITGQRWQRLRDVFDRAADLPPEGRSGAVREMAADDTELREEVLRLLSDITEGEDEFDRSLAPPAADPDQTEPTGIRLGSYRLLREVSHGGMGSVFEALRDDQQFERRVAIKLVRQGPLGDVLLSRFTQERQILAALDHPNIARLLDAGLAPDGRPYLVMEYVDGEEITTYCERRGLDLAERLGLFLCACDAIVHAHRQRIVHSDLKPAHILVRPDRVVKLLDFGIAKLLTDTAPGASPGDGRHNALLPFTPGYASPEQLRGEPVSALSDVYALGVILYELIAGRHPYSTGGESPFELVQLAQAQPTPPSLLAGPRAAGGDRIRLRRGRAGELDDIVLTAMRADVAARYASVEQFAGEVRRFLDERPILAHGSSPLYRARKLVRRHRAGGVAAAVVLVSLAAGIAASAWEAHRAREEARKAEHMRAFLVGLVRTGDSGTLARDGRTTDLLAAAAARPHTELAAEPELLAEIQTAIAANYMDLGQIDRAEPLLASALRIRRGLPDQPRRALAASLGSYAASLIELGNLGRAETLLNEALALLQPATSADSLVLADVRTGIGSMLQARGAWNAAARELSIALSIRRKLLGADHVDVAATLDELATVRLRLGDYASAEGLARQVLALRGRTVPATHPLVPATLDVLGAVLLAEGLPAQAEPYLREALQLRRAGLPAGHWLVASSESVLGECLARLGRDGEAEWLLVHGFTGLRQARGANHPRTREAAERLAGFYRTGPSRLR